MGSRPKRQRAVPRCARCALPPQECLCALLTAEAVRTRVVVLLPVAESRKPTNTGRLLPLLLQGAELRVRGQQGAPLDASGLVDPGRRLLLLDAASAVTLDAELVAADPRPATLVVPDGTWRQARRLMNGTRALDSAQRVSIALGGPTRYRLRNPRGPEKLSTMEAVARALGVLEGPAVEARLLEVFEEFVARTLRIRGTGPGPGED